MITVLFCANLLGADLVPLQASVFGKPLPIDKVTVVQLSPAFCKSGKSKDVADVYEFTFQKGTEFMADNEIKFHLNVNLGSKWDSLTLKHSPVKFGTPEFSKVYHGHSKEASCGRGVVALFVTAMDSKGKSKMDSASDMIGFSLKTKSIGGGKFVGDIYICNAQLKTAVKGQFVFKPVRI